MAFYFYARQIRAAARAMRSAVALLAKPASFDTGRYCVTDGLDPVHFSSRSAAMAWADWLSDQPESRQCEIHVIDTDNPEWTGRIRGIETSSPTWYRMNDRGDWQINLSDPEVADCYYDPADSYR